MVAVKNSFPPLPRGIGTLLVLIAAVVAFCISREHDRNRDAGPSGNRSVAAKVTGEEVAALASEVRELRAEAEQESVVEEVVDNGWFDCIAFAGTVVIAASFFAEAYVRRETSN
jgi:hypothetical protein